MQRKAIALRWAKKLMRAQHFMAMTEREAVMYLDGVDPNSFNDLLMLQAQSASIKQFQTELADLLKAHDKRAAELGASTGITETKRVKKTTTPRKKVPVNKSTRK